MEQPISLQLYQAGFALLTGVAAGALYDCFRALRRQINRPGFTNLADVLFWVMLALALFLQTMAAGRGEVRIFMLIATTGGAILYFLALSAYFLKILEKCLNKILCVLRFVIIQIPIVAIKRYAKKISQCAKRISIITLPGSFSIKKIIKFTPYMNLSSNHPKIPSRKGTGEKTKSRIAP